MIVDAHVHLAKSGSPAAQLFNASATPKTILSQMDKSGVHAAVVIGLPGYQDNSEVLHLCSAAPDRLFPVAGIDPRNVDSIWDMKHLRDAGFFGIKLHPRLNGYEPDCELVYRVLDEAAAHDLPVVIDTLPQTKNIQLSKMEYHAFDRLALRYPEVQIVIAHSCAPHVLEAYTIAKARDNIHLEVSFAFAYYSSTSVESSIGFISRYLDRSIIYGSDFPSYSIGHYLQIFFWS